MNLPTQNTLPSNTPSGSAAADETLRIIASLPVPEGLEDRVIDAMSKAPRTASVLPWPSESRRGWVHSAVARGAAAAAIVFVVGGGGWGVYSRVRPVQTPPKVIAMPRVVTPGGFSSAGAMRTPQTLNGPTLVHPVAPAPDHAVVPKTQMTVVKKGRKPGKAATPVKVAQ
jgi:hypothetical protein